MTQTRGYIYGFIAMFGFGATFIAIALAKESFDPTFVGVGRIIPAGIGAIIGLKLAGQNFYRRAMRSSGLRLLPAASSLVFQSSPRWRCRASRLAMPA